MVEFLDYKQGAGCRCFLVTMRTQTQWSLRRLLDVLVDKKGTKCWVTVRVEVDANKPEYPSVTPRVPAAAWVKRGLPAILRFDSGWSAG
ncbi:hypothetical protein ACLK1S_16790 [Escherichia coli]